MKKILLRLGSILFVMSIFISITTGQDLKSDKQCRNKDKEKCDFSDYNALTISHFLKSAVEQVEPDYPPSAKMLGIHGKVVVSIIVDRNGIVQEACALEGNTLLTNASVSAAKKWKFKKDFGLTPKFKPNVKYINDKLIFNFELNKNDD